MAFKINYTVKPKLNPGIDGQPFSIELLEKTFKDLFFKDYQQAQSALDQQIKGLYTPTKLPAATGLYQQLNNNYKKKYKWHLR